MFTGIVEAMGVVERIEGDIDGSALTIRAEDFAADLEIGASISVNGACLTVVDTTGDAFRVEVVAETLRRTNLDRLREGDRVNLERAMRAAGRFDGHVVQGHVDGQGTIASTVDEGDGRRIGIDLPSDLARYVVEKGSITVDGVSLTVAALTESGFEVAIIPHTLAVTTFGQKSPGDSVNLEVDILAKYVERLLASR